MSETTKLLEKAQKVITSHEATIQKYEEKMEKAREIIIDQQSVLKRLEGSTFVYGIIVGFDKRSFASDIKENDESGEMEKLDTPVRTVVVLVGGQISELNDVEELELKAGDMVKMVTGMQGTTIIEKATYRKSFGQPYKVKDVIDENFCEVVFGDATKVIITGSNVVVKGSRVILDDSASVVLSVVGEEEANEYSFNEDTGVNWDDIGGHSKAKVEIIDAIEGPVLNAAIYEAYGKKLSKGILLYGPPGNGKTMFGKAIATAISKFHGITESGFIYVKGPELLNMYVGATEERIRSLFKTAREFKKRTGSPAVIFIDEAEAILSKRGSGRTSDMDKTIVPQFLAEMDGLSDSAALVVLTTNRPDMLDSAIIREGRIDKKIRIGRPDKTAVESILKLNLQKVPIRKGEKISKIITEAISMIFDKSLVLYELKLKKGSTIPFRYSDIINGAMMAAIVDDAVGMAIRNDVENKVTTPSGVDSVLLQMAIQKSFNQNARMNHESLLEDLEYELNLEEDGIANIKPVKQNVTISKEEVLS